MFKGFKIIKMGFKPETQIDRGCESNVSFSKKRIYKIVRKINKSLDLLYSPAPQGSLWPTIRYSSARDDIKKIENILDRVEKRVYRLRDEVAEIKDDVPDESAAFTKEFLGIVSFLYEADDFDNEKEDESSKKIPDYIKEKFISIAQKLWDTGFDPRMF